MGEEKKQPGSKKPGQKFKSLLVWNILLKKTDEAHALQIKEIVEFLSFYGISAERHSVKRDIDDLLALVNKEYDMDLEANDMDDRELLGYEVEYDAALHGYKVSRRPYEFEEIRLLAECVRAFKFISKSQEAHLLAAIENLCSDYQIRGLPGWQKQDHKQAHNEHAVKGQSGNPQEKANQLLLPEVQHPGCDPAN